MNRALYNKIKNNAAEKVLLVNPQSKIYSDRATRFPLGLFYIASYLKQEFPSRSISILDLATKDIDFDIEAFLESTKPDIVGVTAITPYIASATETGIAVKQVLPEAISIIGGVHVTVLPDEVMDYGVFDFGVIGQGEETFTELVEIIGRKGDISQVEGISFVDNNLIIKTKGREVFKDINEYPFASYSLDLLVGDGDYLITGDTKRFEGKSASIITSRGCPYRCEFCVSSKMFHQVRARSVENVVDELEYLQDRGYKNIYFLDDTFNLNPKRAKSLCKAIIDRNLNIEWITMCRADVPDRELYELMSRAGCAEIAFGIESADPEVLGRMNKETNLEEIEEVIQLVKASGVSVKYFLMVGNPGETLESSLLTARFLEKTKPDKVRIGKTIPYPGSKLYEDHEISVLPGVGYEYYFYAPPPSHPYAPYFPESSPPLRGITYTPTMSPKEIEFARRLLIETHLGYGGE